jgi:hypothetical protein
MKILTVIPMQEELDIFVQGCTEQGLPVWCKNLIHVELRAIKTASGVRGTGMAHRQRGKSVHLARLRDGP